MLLLRAALLLSATPLAAALSTLSRQGVLQGRVSATQAPGYESCVRLEPRSLASGGPLFTCAMDVEAAVRGGPH